MSKKVLLRTCKSCHRRFFSEGEKSISDFYNQSELSYVKLQDFVIEEPTHTLIVIGNGFDKMHGVPSGYYDFRDSMRKGNNLRENLEFLIDSDEL